MENVGVKPGNILVPVSTYYALYPLEAALRRVRRGEAEIVVLHVRMCGARRRIDRRTSCSARSSSCFSPRCFPLRKKRANRCGWLSRRERSVGGRSADRGKSAIERDRGGKFRRINQ